MSAKNVGVVSGNCHQVQGDFVPLTRGFAPGPHWGQSPQTQLHPPLPFQKYFRHYLWNKLCTPVISGKLLKSAFFKGGGSLWTQNFRRKGRCPSTTVGVRKLRWSPFRVVSILKNIRSALFGFVKNACEGRTDGRTDRIMTPKTALTQLRRLNEIKKSH